MSGADTLDIEVLFGQPDRLAQEITSLRTTWKSGRAEWESRVLENQNYVYATSTNETVNRQNPHDHTTHIPKIAQISDNLSANYMAALFPNDDWLRFEGSDPEAEEFDKKKAVLAYINTKNRLNGFRNTVQQLINDWILYGNCFVQVTYVNDNSVDPDTGLGMPGYTGPKLIRISPHDIVFNPLASSFEKSPKTIRSLKTMGELHRDLEENPELGYSAEVIERMQESREKLRGYADSEIDKHIQFQYDGFGSPSLYYKSGFVEILEFYGDIYDADTGTFYKNRVITVADRRFVIRNEPLDTWKGRPNIFHVGWRLRPDNLWAMGPLDNLVGLQYLINHLENARADAFDQIIDPDRVITGDVQIEIRGAARDYWVPEGGAVSHLQPDTAALQADFQIQQKEQQMEEYAGAPRQAMGIRTPGEKTAFEVSELMNAAGRIFQAKITYFEEQLIEPVINAMISTARRHLNTTDIVRVIDDDFGVAEFLQITKEDLTSNGVLVPIGARHFARQATLTQNLFQFMQAMQTDPTLAQHFPAERLARTWEDLLGFKRLELFERFGRVQEELELARLQAEAQSQFEVEQGALDDEGTGPVNQGPI